MSNNKVAPAESKAVEFLAPNTPVSLQQGDKKDTTGAQQSSPDVEGILNVQLSKIRSSFQDLVIYNDQGQPSIDINRLVYKPKKKKHSKEKERLSWYLPDYIFIIFNFLCLTFSAYFFLNGLTIVSWRNSMESFVLKNCTKGCSCENEMNEEICRTIQMAYGQRTDMVPYTIIRFYGFNDVSNHGLVLLSIGFCNILNIILGICACLDGNKTLLISHLVFDVILFVCEVGLITMLQLTGRCDKRDIKIIKLFLERHIKNYAKDEPDEFVKKDTTELDLIQISLTCCGVGNWTDYLPRSTWKNGELLERTVVERFSLDKSDLIIPSSCCRQWWVRNIYCAHEAHMWAYPTITELQAHQFRQRISQWGCLPKMVGLCRNMVAMAGVGGCVAWILHFFLSIVRHSCAITQIRTINTLIRERKRIFKHKETGFEGKLRTDEDEEKILRSLSTILDIFSEPSELGHPISPNVTSQIPFPPTEKEIANMKSRIDFNRLEASMRSTHVEDWVNTGRAFVEGKKFTKGKSNVKIGRDGEKDELPNMLHSNPADHQKKDEEKRPRIRGTVEKVDGGDALNALHLIPHVNGE